MNLKGIKSVTRNGIEYPVMWAKSGSVEELRIVVSESPIVLCVKEGDEDLFKDGDVFCALPWRSYSPQKKPELRPYNSKEIRGMVGKAVLYKETGRVNLIIAFEFNWVIMIIDGVVTQISRKILSQDYENLDGSPCGVLEQ